MVVVANGGLKVPELMVRPEMVATEERVSTDILDVVALPMAASTWTVGMRSRDTAIKVLPWSHILLDIDTK